MDETEVGKDQGATSREEAVHMNVKDKAGKMTQMAASRMREAKLESATERNERLRMKNELLSEELKQERSERDRILEALEKVGSQKKTHRMRGFFMLSTAAAAAYVMGSKAGTERYEQLRSWWNDMRQRGNGNMDAWAGQARETTSQASQGMTRMGEQTASTIQEKGAQASSKLQTAAEVAASKVEQGTSTAADKVEQGTSTAADKVKKGTSTAADATESASRSQGKGGSSGSTG
jgi:G3E family GTPase